MSRLLRSAAVGIAPRRLFAALALLAVLTGPLAAQCQRDVLEALDPALADQLGEAVALDANWLLVGAPSGLPAGQGAGRVLAYRRQAGEWLLEQELLPDGGGLGARFGASVAMDDNLAAVGAPFDDEAGQDAGAVYVWVRLGDAWFNLDKLTASDGAAGDGFGDSVAVSGDRIVVGARRHDALGANAGAAYVYENPTGGASWQEVAKLQPSDGVAGDAFGVSVAADDDVVAVGSDLADDGGVSAGVVHVFRHDGAAFVEEAKLIPGDRMPLAFFGRRLALDDDCLAVGAPGQQVDAAGGAGLVDGGAVYVFDELGPGSWQQIDRLTAFAPAAGDLFGSSLALGDGVLLAGSVLAERGLVNAGSVHVFRDEGGAWSPVRQLFAADAAAGDNFGVSVALDPPFAVVGARFRGVGAASAGAAYVFRGTADLGTWSDLGHALAGSLGEPCVFGEGDLAPNSAVLFSLNGANPDSVTGLVLGAAQADLPFKGGTLVPDPLILLFGLPTLDGRLDLVLGWPAGLPSGVEVYWQHMIADPGGPAGFAGSNAVVAVTP